jgi:hypothetical protein
VPSLTWSIVSSAIEAQSLLDLFGHFHDSCLREIHLSTATSVNEQLGMDCAGHLDTQIRALFQRQVSLPSAIEIEFSKVSFFCMQPTPDNADSIIYRASLDIDDGQFRFSAWCVGLPLRAAPNSTLTAVPGDPAIEILCGEMLWRDKSEWMGSKLRYGVDPVIDA